MIVQILKQFQKLICMFVILLMTLHHVLPSPLITNSTLHKRQTPLDESEISRRNNNYDYGQQGYNYGGVYDHITAYKLDDNAKFGLLGGALPVGPQPQGGRGGRGGGKGGKQGGQRGFFYYYDY
ncbi:uncharacterized protein LOC111056547 [Nilaparvata lugens]|uniref:uncharacterized protein LOC111056547 n=1 Tax=Nilaparvata lugens TaxID=108931 RepID=UPI000B98A326|nr:uncharacterized protein LOC111056547 [Nilaparvata lugens]